MCFSRSKVKLKVFQVSCAEILETQVCSCSGGDSLHDSPSEAGAVSWNGCWVHMLLSGFIYALWRRVPTCAGGGVGV